MFYSSNFLYRQYTIDDFYLLETLYLDWNFKNVDKYFVKTQFENQILPQYEKYNAGVFAVFDKEEGSYFGHCGVKYNENAEEWYLSFRFLKSFWKNDAPVEVISSCLEYGFKRLKINEIVVDLEQKNNGAAKMLQKAGMKHRMTILENDEKLERFSAFAIV